EYDAAWERLGADVPDDSGDIALLANAAHACAEATRAARVRALAQTAWAWAGTPCGAASLPAALCAAHAARHGAAWEIPHAEKFADRAVGLFARAAAQGSELPPAAGDEYPLAPRRRRPG